MESDPASLVSPGPLASRRGGYGSLLFGVGSWFGFWGIHMVMFQWLVVDQLGAPPAQVGSAQMAVSLPALFFLLLGGALADRLDPTRVLPAIHLATAVVVGGLAVAFALGFLSYPLLIVYGVSVGVMQAFGFPARDSLLSVVVRGSMSRAVTGATLVQHSSQLVGAFVAGSASALGGTPVLAFQTLLVATGVVPLGRLPRSDRPRRRERISLGEIRAGLSEVAGSTVLRPVMVLAVAIGLLFVGPYVVLLPLLVRDVYGGGSAEMAVLTAMFPLGSVLGGLAIFWRGGLRRSGRSLALGNVIASGCIGAMALGLPFSGSALAVLGWGLAGSLFINAGRTLFQSHASEANRARVLSVYTLGVMGGAPIGSLLAGLLATPLGLHGTLALDAAVAFGIVVVVVATTSLWQEP